MTTVQMADRTRDELMQRKRATGAVSLDAVVWELLHPRPRREAVLERLRDLRGVLETMGVRRLWLFGSVVRDAARPGSDVDLVVELAPERDLFDLARVQRTLDAAVGAPCDVVTPGGLHPRLADGVWAEAEGVF